VPINVTINANAEKALQGITGLGRSLAGLQKVVDRVFPKGGANTGPALMSRQMEQLTRRTQAATQQLQTLQETLKKVSAEHAKVAGFGGPGGDGAKALERQVKQLQTQIRSQQARVGNLQTMQQVAAGMPAPPPPRKREEEEGGGGGGGAMQYLGALGRGMLGPMALLATGAGAAALVKIAYSKAANDMKARADLFPRTLGNLGNDEMTARALRRQGRTFGFNAQESYGAFGALSSGGGHFGGGLERDAQTAMQMARMFGLDVGGQAGTLAEAQKMGAFKSGDAKRFAQILAQEIAHSGLGPRAEEVQQATLMLLNSAMSTQARAGAGGLMGLQTLFNRTGIPAFQGMRGAGIIASMQGQFNNPGSDRDSALDQLVMRQLGVKGYYKQERFRETAFQDPRLLAQYIKTVRANTKRSPQEDELETTLKGRFPELTYSRLEALRKATGNFSAITPAAVRGALAPGGADLATGAKKAMGMAGNKLRMGEATLDDFAIRVGTPIVNAVAKAADWGSKEYDQLANIFDNTKSMVDLLQGLSDHFLGTKATGAIQQGMSTVMGDNTGLRGRLDAMSKHGIPEAALGVGLMDLAHRLFVGGAAAEPGKLWKSQLKGIVGATGLRVASEDRPGAITSSGHPSLHSFGQALDIAGSPARMGALFDAIKRHFPGQINELFYSPKGFVKHDRYFSPGSGFGGKALRDDHFDHVHIGLRGHANEATLRIILEEVGVASEASKRALHKAIRQSVGALHEEHSRTQPNRVNTR
jgi:hypothetical protein